MKPLFTSSFRGFFWRLFWLLCICIAMLVVSFEIYNPVKKTVGSENANLTRTYINNEIASLPKKIVINYNNIGYLGENFSDTIKRKRVLFLGSSTTQSFYISLEQKWTTLCLDSTRYWSNNCGVDGSRITVFGEEVKALSGIKPNYVIILLDPFHDDNLQKEIDKKAWLLNKLNSLAIFKYVFKPLYISKLKSNQKIGHRSADWGKEIKENPENYFATYRFINSRKLLDSLTKTILSVGATPIYISHSTPYGKYTDLNGLDISKVEGSLAIDSYYAQFSSMVESFCTENKVPFINGYRCAKGTENFYDYTHFSIIGSSRFANCIKPSLDSILNSNRGRL